MTETVGQLLERLKKLDNYDLIKAYVQYVDSSNSRAVITAEMVLMERSFELFKLKEDFVQYHAREKEFLKGTYTHSEYRKKGGLMLFGVEDVFKCLREERAKHMK